MAEPNLCPNCGGRLRTARSRVSARDVCSAEAMMMEADGPSSRRNDLRPRRLGGLADPRPDPAGVPARARHGRHACGPAALGRDARPRRRRALSAPGGDRPRRHGRRAQGPRRRPRPRPGRQGPARSGTATSPELVRRFVEEAQIGGQLQHPGIVPVYELGTLRRPPAVLRHEAGQGPHPGRRCSTSGQTRRDDLPRFLAIFEQVCQTMAYAHARGVIHRDLKPSNVMVGAFGEVQVMDWGLAKVLPRGASPTTSGAASRPSRDAGPHRAERLGRRDAVAGRVACWARRRTWPPSRPGARSTRLDERADVFGLGAILCEILTGRPPFAGRSYAETLELAAAGDTSEAVPGRAGGRRCLADPDRPRDAGEVARAMTAYLAGCRSGCAAELAASRPRPAEEERKRPGGDRVLRRAADGVGHRRPGVAIGRNAQDHLAAANTASDRLVEANAQEARPPGAGMARLDLALAAIERYHEGVSGELILREPTMQPLRTRLLTSALEFYTKLQRVLEAEPGDGRCGALRVRAGRHAVGRDRAKAALECYFSN